MTPIEPNERITFKVRHEGDGFVVVDKPARVVTQPGVGHENDTLLNGLFALWGTQLAQLGAARGYGLLHRLDKETSGLVIIALRTDAYEAIRAQFEARALRKFYWAVVRGRPKGAEGVVRLGIEEQVRRASRYTSTKTARLSRSGAPALTAWRLLSEGTGASLIEARPVTGRLHQVRVHMESIGCPILGDDTYAPPTIAKAASRLALHAHRLLFEAPGGGAVDVQSPWPRDLRTLLNRFGLSRPDLPPSSGVPEGPEGAHEVGGDPVGEEDA